MMKSKKIMALLIASVFALALPLSACVPDDPVTPTPGGEDEYTVTLDYNDEVSRPRLVYVEKEQQTRREKKREERPLHSRTRPRRIPPFTRSGRRRISP